MGSIVWIVGGLVVAAAIVAVVVFFHHHKTQREEPLPANKLPKDWDAVMPREKPANRRKNGQASKSYSKFGSKKGLSKRR